jgi:peptidoglycan/xylan/chitin deacetylase (PgdA/CDA1 family)
MGLVALCVVVIAGLSSSSASAVMPTATPAAAVAVAAATVQASATSSPMRAAAYTTTPLPLELPSASVSPSGPRASGSTAVKVPMPAATLYPYGSLPPAGAMAPIVGSGSRAYPEIAITVDDCLNYSAVANDLTIFEEYHVNATWFPIGWEAYKNADLWRMVDRAGFPIANHTYDHEDLTLKTYEQVYADIEQDNDFFYAILGHPIMPFVRPFGGHYNSITLQAAAAAGERAVVDWDTDEGDADGDYTNIARLISLGERGVNGSIILMHANGGYTTAALPSIIAYYRNRGFTFVTLGQLLGVPGPVPYGPVYPTPTATPSPTPRPSPTATRTPRPTKTPKPSATPTPSPSPSPSPGPSTDPGASTDPGVIPQDSSGAPRILPDAAVTEPPWP